MVDTLARLVGPKTLESTTTAQYSSTGKSAVIRHIHVSNPTVNDVVFTLSIGVDAVGTRLFDGYTIPAKSVFSFTCNMILLSADGANAICAHAGTANALTITVSGVEVT